MLSFKFFATAATAILTLLPVRIQAYPNPLPFTGDITTPLGSSPTMCKSGSTYFIFTGGVGIPIYTSTDLKAWTHIGTVFPSGAPWTAPFTGGDNLRLWAPDCKIVDGGFRLFYAASTLGSQNSGIFYAHSTTGASGTWTNGGLVLSSSDASNFNAIDPNLSVDSVPYLAFGSYWSGIKGVALDPATYLPLTSTYDSLAFRNNGVQPAGAPNSEEAPVIWSHGGFFYLFTSWNADKADYQVHVARSSIHNSGYVGEAGLAALNNGGGVILPAHDLILGPGGQDVFVDTDGTVYLVYRASFVFSSHLLLSFSSSQFCQIFFRFTPDYKVGTALTHHIGLNKLDMSSGWPVVV